MALDLMQYGTFIWPNNPASCSYSCDRAFAKHKYPELEGVELEDMDPDAVIISGKGEFFGVDAYDNWNKLVEIYKSHGVKEFKHPIFKDITQGLMIKLQSDLEPRENYISYTFEIIQHIPPVSQSSNVLSNRNSPSVSYAAQTTNSSKVAVGDIVICNGTAYYSSDGKSPTVKLTNKQLTVTRTNYGSKYPIHVGSIGWMAASSVKKTTSSNTTSVVEYVVKPGDTLSKICSRYSVDWKIVAKYNNLKNPNLIYPGQKIKIQK